MSRTEILSHLPRLRKMWFSVTSPPTPDYNCIAWAAGDTSRWWWPKPTIYHWPEHVAREADLPSFIAAFATLGYAPCPDGTLEKDFEKVAIFADRDGRPTHAARQLPSGRWTSKLGKIEDISHSIYGVEGAAYGEVVQYLQRSKKS